MSSPFENLPLDYSQVPYLRSPSGDDDDWRVDSMVFAGI